jgi:hypothetical protein
MSASEDEDSGREVPDSLDELECPGCDDFPPARFPRTIVDVDGVWWHPICALEAHPKIEQREVKRCPKCGTYSEYRPLTREPEARSCPHCLDVFPEDAPKQDGVTADPSTINEVCDGGE